MGLKEIIEINSNILEWFAFTGMWVTEAIGKRVERLHLSDHSLYAPSEVVIIAISEDIALLEQLSK